MGQGIRTVGSGIAGVLFIRQVRSLLAVGDTLLSNDTLERCVAESVFHITVTARVAVKKAIKMDSTINVYGTEEPNPLAALGRMFAEKPPRFIEAREVNGRSVEVYRYIREPRNTT